MSDAVAARSRNKPGPVIVPSADTAARYTFAQNLRH